MLKQAKTHVTWDRSGQVNGRVVTLWHSDDGPAVDQVYLTVVSPRKVKGPHLHRIRRGLFFCIKGHVEIVTRENGQYRAQVIGEQVGEGPVVVPPGVPAAIYNRGYEDAFVLNMPSPGWRATQPDENPVEDWTYEPKN